MENKYINNGFVTPVIEDDHYILGSDNALPQVILRVDGDWTDSLPEFESQLKQFETYSCTSFGTLNALETLANFTHDVENFSDRFLGIVAGTKPPGNDPHVVAEALRNYGAIPEEVLPFSPDLQNIDDYYSYTGANKSVCLVQGQRWLSKYFYKHEWVLTDTTAKSDRLTLMKQALQYSPLCVSVTAWFQNPQGLYYSPQGLKNGHWCVVYKIDDTGIYVFDSYQGNNPSAPSSYLKKLTLDHDIQFSKRYSLTQKVETKESQLSWIEQIIRSIAEALGLLKKQIDALPPPVVIPPVVVKKNLLNDFCQAIADFEGGPGDLNYTNNNPGNIRGSDGKFLTFSSWVQGFAYLKEYVKRACTDKHPAYKSTFTFYQFFNVYAPSEDHNQPNLYAETVCRRIGVLPTDKITILLST